MTAKDPDWDRRIKDGEVKDQVLKTLGSVQKAVDLFEKSLTETKAHFELKASQLEDRFQEHEELLNGTAKEEGFFQWMHQADRNIKALVKGVLGEDGANYEKSIKGKLDKAIADIKELRVEWDTRQIADRMQAESLNSARTYSTTRRGQNILIWVALISLIGTLGGVIAKELAPKWWEQHIHRKPALTSPARSPARRTRKAKAVPKLVAPPIEPPAEPEPQESPAEPEPDMSRPTPAPLNPY